MPIQGSLLTALLREISSVLERSPINLYYSHALLELGGGKAQVTGRNSEFQLQIWQEADVPELTAVVPARELLAILEKLSGEVELKTAEATSPGTGDSLIILGQEGRSRYRLPTLPVEDYPHLDGGEMRRALEVEAARLAEMLDLVTYAAAKSDPRPALNGICFEFLTDRFAAVATDGIRLASAELPLRSELGEEKRPILPGRAAAELRRLLKGREGKVAIFLGDGAMRLAGDGFALTSHLIAASFPRWRELISGYETKAILELNRKELEQALSRVLVVLGKQNRMRVTSDRSDVAGGASPSTFHSIRIEAEGDLGEAAEEVAVEVVSGEPFEIHFNPRYLLEALRKLRGEKVRLRLTGAFEPAFLEGEPEEVEATHLVMPVRA